MTHGATVELGRRAVRRYGQATARWRPDPDFLVIGAKRGGSTSFYFDLLGHSRLCPLFPRPNLLPKTTQTKGVHYFDSNYFRGERWYRSWLPSSLMRTAVARRAGGPAVVGEASPYYLFHPAAAARAAAMLPDVKIIAVLRDPVMRTYSHWKERRRGGFEELSFADALAAEDERIGDAGERLRTDPRFHSYAHEQQSYARQSEYDVALEQWYRHYPADQVFVVASERYYREPDRVFDRVQDFLALPREHLGTGAVRNAASGEALDAGIRRELVTRFAAHNERLAALTGQTFDW